MSKFDKMLYRVSRIDFKDSTQIDKALTEFRGLQVAVKSRVDDLCSKEMLDNGWQPWYTNARESWESRLDKIEGIIKALETKKDDCTQA